MGDKLTLRVDPVHCLGTGTCADLAPHAFAVVDGLSTPRLDQVDAGDEAVQDAVQACPTMAISTVPAAGTPPAP